MTSSRPFGINAWAAAYLPGARLVLGTSAAGALRLSELAGLAGFDPQELLADDPRLEHGRIGGAPQLRELIAARAGARGVDEVALTAGAGDALFALAWTLVGHGHHAVVEVPAHQGVFAALERSGGAVTELLAPVALDALLAAIGPRTTAVFVTSPHNPTGHIWEPAELRLIAEAAGRVGAVLVVDEAFWGVGIGKPVPPRAAGLGTNVVSVGSLSKVHGLPGLRIGWAAGPTLVADDVRALRADVVRSSPLLSERLALYALQAEEALLNRTRKAVAQSLPLLAALADRHPLRVELPLPDGGTVAFVRLPGVDAEAWCHALAVEAGLLLAPGGACFGLPGHVAANLALQSSVWEEAVPLLDAALARLPVVAGSP